MDINLPIGKNNLIDVIDKFFLSNGQKYKTGDFNIIINNTPRITNESKKYLESYIKDSIKELIPANTTLNNIIWQ